MKLYNYAADSQQKARALEHETGAKGPANTTLFLRNFGFAPPGFGVHALAAWQGTRFEY